MTGEAAGHALSMALPPALQPWRQWLVWFPPSLAEVLGELLCQLDPLLGPLGGPRQRMVGEPEGVEGLHTRGPYERLLSSEWLLAQELPDEFLRRAVAGEHLFLAPRQAAPQVDRQIVALFDAGPLQLGAPRLAHLAWWILLARRAAQAGAVLRWGFLQAPGALHEARRPHDLERLRRGRSFAWATAEHWAGWQEALAASSTDAAHEHWWVGGTPASVPPPVSAPGLVTHAVQVCRGLDGESLSLTMTQRAQVRSFVLQLPPAAQGALLLQGQPAPRTHQARSGEDAFTFSVTDRLALSRPPVFSATGGHVAVMGTTRAGAWVAPLPHVRARKRREPRWNPWSAQARPLSLFFVRQRLAALMAWPDGTGMTSLWQVPGQSGPWRMGDGDGPKLPPGTSRWLPMLILAQGPCVLDAAGGLWLNGNPVDSGVVGLQAMGLGVSYVVSTKTHWTRRFMRPGWNTGRPQIPAVKVWHPLPTQGGCGRIEGFTLPGPVDVVHFCVPNDLDEGACAGRLKGLPEERWQIVVGDRHTEPLVLGAGWRGVGLMRTREGRHALLCLADDGKRLFQVDEFGMQACYTAPFHIMASQVCPVSGRVALVTAARQLIVFNAVTKALELVLHSAPAAGEEEAE